LSSLSAMPVVDQPDPFVPEECKVAARAAETKSGDDTVILAVGDLLGVTDAFVITSGRNARQVKTMVDEVERQVYAATGHKPIRVEGLDDVRWVLMDYGDFLVHVFLDEARDFYDLEHLWADAPRIPWRPTEGI
jgi:ribosome-associated protein